MSSAGSGQGSGAKLALAGLAEAVEERHGFTVFRVPARRLREAAERLRGAGYTYLLSISGVDEPKQARIRVVYHFTRPDSPGEVVALETSVPRDEPRLPSIHDIYPAALFQEREEHEMLGIVFEGLPDTRHLLLPPDWPPNVYPLRKDYRVADEPFMSRRPSKPLEELRKRLAEEEAGAAGARG
jgi:NADH:ubiquinone oxidoreductase subunit C